MRNEIQLVRHHQLQVGDRLVREKGIFSKHHGIYVGIHNDQALVAENQDGYGVRYILLSQFLNGAISNLSRIERFPGNEQQRAGVIPRINQLLGQAYNLVSFNCEHFANLIQHGRAYSRQVNNAAWGILAATVFLGLIGGSSKK